MVNKDFHDNYKLLVYWYLAQSLCVDIKQSRHNTNWPN